MAYNKIEKSDPALMPENIINRTMRSVRWNVISNVIFIFFGVIQTLILARLIPVKFFGIYALAHSIVWLTGMIANMGMGAAFLHRAEETEDEDLAANVMFTLKLIYTLIWLVLLLSLTLIFSADSDLRLAMLVLILANAATHLCQTPNTILVRRIQHKRLAIIQMFNSILTLISSVSLALSGFQLLALLISAVVTAVVNISGLYLWKPFWKPRLMMDARIRAYFWKFGSRTMLARLLLFTNDRIDDIWTGWILGTTMLGFYSQAYTLATYPRRILSESIKGVVTGTYAELKSDPERLAKTFEISNGLIIRAGFLIAGGLFLVAPEFIRLLLGEKWLPMLNTFQIMLLFIMLDPIRETTADVFIALGQPEILVQSRVIQFIILFISLILLTPRWGIEGVAISVVIMVFSGIFHLLWMTKKNIVYSIRRIFLVPALCLFSGIVATHVLSQFLIRTSEDWINFLVKGAILTMVYCSIWALLEHQHIRDYLQIIRNRGSI